MNVSLSAELERFVKTQVISGMYNNASEVIRDSLRSMMGSRFYKLKQAIDLGFEQAESGEVLDANTVHKHLQHRLKARAKKFR